VFVIGDTRIGLDQLVGDVIHLRVRYAMKTSASFQFTDDTQVLLELAVLCRQLAPEDRSRLATG